MCTVCKYYTYTLITAGHHPFRFGVAYELWPQNRFQTCIVLSFSILVCMLRLIYTLRTTCMLHWRPEKKPPLVRSRMVCVRFLYLPCSCSFRRNFFALVQSASNEIHVTHAATYSRMVKFAFSTNWKIVQTPKHLCVYLSRKPITPPFENLRLASGSLKVW